MWNIDWSRVGLMAITVLGAGMWAHNGWAALFAFGVFTTWIDAQVPVIR